MSNKKKSNEKEEKDIDRETTDFEAPQKAMEFLMTYGWAILVVISCLAALTYFEVIDPSQLLPHHNNSTFIPTPAIGLYYENETCSIVDKNKGAHELNNKEYTCEDLIEIETNKTMARVVIRGE